MPTTPDRDSQIDADHPRPDRATPYRTGQGHGDDQVCGTGPDAGLTGDDIHDGDDAEVEHYRNSPGAGLLRNADDLPEPNEPG